MILTVINMVILCDIINAMNLEQKINNVPEKITTNEPIQEVVLVEAISEEDRQFRAEDKAQKEKENNEEITKKREEILKYFNQENKEVVNEIKEGIDFVFEQTPELSDIGTPQEYSRYLDTIFPNSKVKDVVYHYTSFKNQIMNDGFKSISELGYWAGAGDIDAIFLTKSPISYWGGEKSKLDKVASVVDSNNPIDLSHLSNETTDEDELSEKDLIIYKKYKDTLGVGHDNAWIKYKNPTKIQIAEEVKNEFMKQGYDSILHPELKEVVVFDKKQTHVLGSKQDIEQFKEFVSKTSTKKVTM